MKSILAIVVTGLLVMCNVAVAGEDSTHRLHGTGPAFYELKGGLVEFAQREAGLNVAYDADYSKFCTPSKCSTESDMTKTPFYNLRRHTYGEDGEGKDLRDLADSSNVGFDADYPKDCTECSSQGDVTKMPFYDLRRKDLGEDGEGHQLRELQQK
jgi:hypothetical protein